jgi:DNA-binding IclR family transcriptional regulator
MTAYPGHYYPDEERRRERMACLMVAITRGDRSLRQLAERCRIPSSSVVRDYVDRLEAMGYVAPRGRERCGRRHRGNIRALVTFAVLGEDARIVRRGDRGAAD